MRASSVFVSCISFVVLVACGDDTAGGGSGAGGTSQGGAPQGGAPQGGEAQGGEAQGGEAQGGEAQGGNGTGGEAQGGNGTGGAGECVPSGSGSGNDVDCDALCADVVAAGCAEGPQNPGQCVPVCESLKTECAGFDTFIDCAGAEPAFECVADAPFPTTCAAEYNSCVVPCLPM